MPRTLARRHIVGTAPLERSTWLSWAKVVSIAAVVLIHVTAANAVVDGAWDYGLGRVAILLNRGSLFAVPVFVMISGALVLDPSRYHGARPFLAKRALRLVPAIIFWHLFYFVLRNVVLGWDTSVREYVALTLNGSAFTALYFFWIVLGLSLISPILIPWIASASRRQIAIAGLGLAMLPGLTVATAAMRGRAEVWVDTPWTWWVFYLGLYVLGWALRPVVLRGAGLLVGCLAFVLLGAYGAYAWYGEAVPSEIRSVMASGYYNLVMVPYAALALVLLHSFAEILRRHERIARVFTRRRGRLLGDATLGVFALHMTLVSVLVPTGLLGDSRHTTSWLELALRYLAVLVGTYTIVLVLRKVPIVRRVL